MVEAPKIGDEAEALKSIRDPLISLSPVKCLPSRITENDPEAYAYSLRNPPNTRDVGAPNITGQANLSNGWGGVADNGALKRQGRTDAPGGGAANGTNLQFDASWSSSIYRVNSTVQPASIRLIPSIKT